MTLSGRDIVLLDGGMGQELRHRSDRPATPLWSAQVMMDDPELVVAVHRDYIEAGATVITLNTYAATPQRLARDGDPAMFEELQRTALRAAADARERSGRDVAIAGCLPPLVASYRPDVASGPAESLEAYRRIVAAQAEGVDLFVCETMSVVHEAEAATRAAAETGKPVWTSFTVDDGDGTRLRSFDPLAAAARSAIDAGAQAVLVNCSIPEQVTRAMTILADAGVPYGGYANGFTSIEALEPGGTVDSLQARSDLGPDAYADHVMGWVEGGAAIVGGCCEVGPAHIAELHRRLTAAGAKVVGGVGAPPV